MRRLAHGAVRPGWEATNSTLGLVYNRTGDKSYWREGPFYDFDLDEILMLEQAAANVQRMCVEAGDHLVAGCPRRDPVVRAEAYLSSVCQPSTCPLSRAGIPEYVHEQVLRTWHDHSETAWGTDFSPNIYGRFDFWYAGKGTTPKLLEYNAQTPTSLLEASVIQWHWLERTSQTLHPDRQWNSIHERLVDAWQRNMTALRAARPWLPERPTIHFAYQSEQSYEDLMNIGYLSDTAHQAGYPVQLLEMPQIGVDMADNSIVYNGRPIDVIFMLYPWEWLWHEEGGKPIFMNMASKGTVWIEPPWTAALWSNKTLLPVLWELFGDTPEGRELLLPAYFTRPEHLTSYARKPIWSREGANVSLVRDGATLAAIGGEYGAEGYVYQELRELPEFDGSHPVLGVWMIDGEPAGMGIREGDLITGNTSHFIPHTIGSYL